jgi:hypothetical protein
MGGLAENHGMGVTFPSSLRIQSAPPQGTLSLGGADVITVDFRGERAASEFLHRGTSPTSFNKIAPAAVSSHGRPAHRARGLRVDARRRLGALGVGPDFQA